MPPHSPLYSPVLFCSILQVQLVTGKGDLLFENGPQLVCCKLFSYLKIMNKGFKKINDNMFLSDSLSLTRSTKRSEFE